MRSLITILCSFLFAGSLIFAQSNLNNSILFDGAGNGTRIRIVDGYSINPGANQNAYQITGNQITLESWVYPMGFPPPPDRSPIIERPLPNGADPYFSYSINVSSYNGYPQLSFGISDGTPGNVKVVADPDTLRAFQWTHIAGTYDGANLCIYVNGVLKATTPASIAITGSGVGLYLGRFLYSGYKGLIDEARIWNVARSRAQIQSDMNNELSGSETGLAGYWKMNSVIQENGYPVITDFTSNHNDLIVQGNAPAVPLSATTPAGTPSFTFTPSSVDYGTVEQGSGKPGTLHFNNTSGYPLLGSIQAQSSSVNSSGGAFYVPANGSQDVTTTIVPLTGGNISGNLLLSTNDGNSTTVPFSINSISLQRFDANNIGMWLQRDGRFARDPISGNAGFEWPVGTGKTAVFASGIWLGAKVAGNVRTAAAVYGTEFSPGPSINGAASDPNNLNYRVYKINKGDNAGNNQDYADWPAALGAPVDTGGNPKVLGDQTLFSVYNDFDASRHFFGTAPLGAEVQQTTFGFDSTSGPLSNTVFLRFKIINKSSSTWDSAYVSLWSDPDLGYAFDDLVGIDTSRNMGYVYNGSNNDGVYGSPPPALGYKILKGAFFTKPIQAFANYNNSSTPPNADPQDAAQAYNFMQGKLSDGTPYIDPHTSQPTLFSLNGDPVTGSGWIDQNPNDRRFLFSTGPFNLEPGQSKEMIAAIIVGQGTDYLNSITKLRSDADSVQSLFDKGYIFGSALENVTSSNTAPNSAGSLNDLANSSTTIDYNTGSSSATVEVGSYAGPPPGSQDINSPSISGVGKYMDVRASGSISWPVNIKIYYTANDLAQAGVLESDLLGIYYWDSANNVWNLYSNSGLDDQGRGTSTTSVDTNNVTIDGVNYEGYVSAVAYHLTPIKVGAAKKTISDRYHELIDYINSLPLSDFKKPGEERQESLVKSVSRSEKKYDKGNNKEASKILAESVLNHLVAGEEEHEDHDKKGHDDKGKHKGKHAEKDDHNKSDNHFWVKDNSARDNIVGMINDILKVLGTTTPHPDKSSAAQMETQINNLPATYSLSQNYPNPFNPSTTIQFSIPEGNFVTLKIYDTLGREVATLVNKELAAGTYNYRWNADKLTSGIYFYRIVAGNYIVTRKMILMK